MKRYSCLFLIFFLLSACHPSASVELTPSPSNETTSETQESTESFTPVLTPPVWPSEDLTATWTPNGTTITATQWDHVYSGSSGDLLEASGVFPSPQGVSSVITQYYLEEQKNFETRAIALSQDIEAVYAQEQTGAYTMTQQSFVECDSGGFLSIRREEHVDTGGPHGETRVFCDNFRLLDGEYLTLDNFFIVPRETYLPVLIECIREIIETHPEDFYDSWEADMPVLFPYETFCVSPQGLSLFFPEENIAPFALGIVRMDIPWAAISNLWQLP